MMHHGEVRELLQRGEEPLHDARQPDHRAQPEDPDVHEVPIAHRLERGGVEAHRQQEERAGDARDDERADRDGGGEEDDDHGRGFLISVGDEPRQEERRDEACEEQCVVDEARSGGPAHHPQRRRDAHDDDAEEEPQGAERERLDEVVDRPGQEQHGRSHTGEHRDDDAPIDLCEFVPHRTPAAAAQKSLRGADHVTGRTDERRVDAHDQGDRRAGDARHEFGEADEEASKQVEEQERRRAAGGGRGTAPSGRAVDPCCRRARPRTVRLCAGWGWSHSCPRSGARGSDRTIVDAGHGSSRRTISLRADR